MALGLCALVLLVIPAAATTAASASTSAAASRPSEDDTTRAKRGAKQRKLAVKRIRTPQKAICETFGSHCGEALAVAHCESRFQTSARNGQYLGLFQMGASERQLFGHGHTADEQARAAYRYFVVSGRDWSPWSCRP